MKKINWLFTALAGLVLASCTGEDLSETPPVVKPPKQDVPILFSFTRGNTTRAENYFTGAEAAKLLGNKFVVTGFKGEKTATPGSIVFDNYLVEYAANTANTTESNSSNWEYVGITPIAHATTNGITSQTIKYWDYSVDQYDFFAWSTGGKTAIYSGTPASGQVLVSNIQPNSNKKSWTAASGDDPDRIAYTFTGSAADLSQCYISDLVTVNKGDAGTYGEVANGYDKTVTLKFRQLGTKVRIGIYETVPGYSVKNVKFYTKGGLLTKTGDVLDAGQIVDNATIFSAGSDIYTEGTYKVYFPTVDNPTNADNNQAHIKFDTNSGTKTTTVDLGELKYTYKESGEKNNGAVYLGRTSNTATYAGNAENNYYVVYLPNETGANLNLRVDFTLESIDGSGETIEVKNAKAQVPSIYTTWKPGFAYTYLFKISDNTNGRTGVYDPTQADDATINSDPAGLYPITFDAYVVNAEDNDQTQETITTIATPSITTYQNGSTVVNNNEYTVLTPDATKKVNGHIYVTVNDNASPGDLITLKSDPEAANGVALYIIPAGMTEAEVVDALTYQDVDDTEEGTIKGRSGKVLTKTPEVTVAGLAANKWALTNSVEYGVNGNAISVGNNQALRFQPAATTTYAFVYTKTAANADNSKEIYEAIAAEKLETFTGNKYRYAYKATEKSHSVGNTDYFDAQKGHVYFTKTGTDPNYTYSLVAKPFIGQGATNLFTCSGAGTTESPYVYTKATTDYAQSGVTYYYTTNGQTYNEAHLVAYADNMLSGLYEEDTTPGTYKATSDTAPVDGKAYYFKDGVNYIYCVFLPQQVNGMYELDKDAEKVETTEDPVDGQTYFDKYNYNDAERYAKVIKVQ